MASKVIGTIKKDFCPSCETYQPIALFRDHSIGHVCVFCIDKHEKELEQREVEKKRSQNVERSIAEIALLEQKQLMDKQREKRTQEVLSERRKAINKARAERKTRKAEVDADKEEEARKSQMVQELASREVCRRHLLPFIQRFNDSYEAGWVHKDICVRLEKFSADIAEGKSPRLMLFLPPRSGKSEIASRSFPAWHLGRYPEHEFISCSYSADLAMDFSRKVREVIRLPEYGKIFRETKMDRDSQRIDKWATTANGGYTAAGIGGPITGRGANCVFYRSLCTTPRGIIPISEVRVGDEVLGYDHKTNRSVWTRVKAVSTQWKSGLISINGTGITPEHRVWTEERGYVEGRDSNGLTTRMQSVFDDVRAFEERGHSGLYEAWPRHEVLLQPGVFKSSESRKNYMSDVWGQESSTCSSVQILPFGGVDCRLDVRSVWNRVPTDCEGTQTQPRSAWRRYKNFLQQNLLRHTPLFEPYQEGQREGRLSCLWNQIKREASSLLFFGVLPRTSGAGRGVQWELEFTQEESKRTGWDRLCALWAEKKGYGCPSHRSRREEQHVGEPSVVVSEMPQPLSSAEFGVCAMDIARLLPERRSEEECLVVDIQTTTENFFCENNLLHNCFIIDDPVKNSDDANSESIRRSVKEWYTSTAYTRLAPGGGMLVIMTRWHDDDLAGWLLHQMEKDEGDTWEVIKYPAIATEDERYRKKGEALHSERYPIEALERIKKTVGSRVWSALYQQNPVADEGEFFNRGMFKMYSSKDMPSYESLTYYTAWDLAIGQKESNDESFGVTVGMDRNRKLWVVDVRHGRWGSEALVDQILDCYTVWKSSITGIERGQIEMAIGPYLEQRIRERGLGTMFIQKLLPGRRDKQARARPIQALMERGDVMFRDGCDDTVYLINQMLRFPSGVRDDGVDSLAWIGQLIQNMTISREAPVQAKGRRKEGWQTRMRKELYGSGGGSHMTS